MNWIELNSALTTWTSLSWIKVLKSPISLFLYIRVTQIKGPNEPLVRYVSGSRTWLIFFGYKSNPTLLNSQQIFSFEFYETGLPCLSKTVARVWYCDELLIRSVGDHIWSLTFWNYRCCLYSLNLPFSHIFFTLSVFFKQFCAIVTCSI